VQPKAEPGTKREDELRRSDGDDVVEDLGKGKGSGEDKEGKGDTKITRLACYSSTTGRRFAPLARQRW
jgi:hypothetical protein